HPDPADQAERAAGPAGAGEGVVMTVLTDRPTARRVPVWVTNLAIATLVAALWPASGLLDTYLDPYFLQILIVIGINIVLATSLNLINGIAGQFSLGHAGFMAVGAYAAGIVFKHYHFDRLAPLAQAPAFLGVVLLAGVL